MSSKFMYPMFMTVGVSEMSTGLARRDPPPASEFTIQADSPCRDRGQPSDDGLRTSVWVGNT